MSRHPSWGPAVGQELVGGLVAVEPLGGGRRTEVWRCTGPDGDVVVKLLRPGRTDVGSLRREAAALRAVDHPAFPALTAAELDGEPAWLAVTAVPGTTVAAHVATHGPLDEGPLRALAGTIAHGLAHLHERGLVHLDVKPTNVVLGPVPVLVDLGSARPAADASVLTRPVGTWHTRAPEQQLPDPGVPVGRPSDVWGLGATLLLAATGAAPLRARRDDVPPTEAVLAARCAAAADDVPGDLAPLVRACLAPAAAERPTAAEVAAAVDGGRSATGGLLGRIARAVRG